MRSRRTPDPAWSDAAARRLAELTADLTATRRAPAGEEAPVPSADSADPAVTPADDWWADHTRVRIPVVFDELPPQPDPAPSVPTPPTPPTPPAAPAAPAAWPEPGRRAARRSRSPVRPAARLPSLTAAHVAVVAVLVAVGLGVAAWWVLREPTAPVPAATEVQPLLPGDPSTAADTGAPLPSGPAKQGSPTDPTGPADTADTADTVATVTVDVTGKVRRPGIVVLDAGARVVDAVEAAGGARPGVDLSSINLARVLVDGEQIVVGAPATAGAMPSPSTVPTPGTPGTLVNLNLATEAELETLPEVGPVTAAAIVAWRTEHGGFTSVDELIEVDGIGEKTLETLSPYVTV